MDTQAKEMDEGSEAPDLERQRTETQKISSHTLQLVQSRIQPPESLVRETAFVAILCMAQFMTQVGLAQSIAPLRIIGDSFGTNHPGELSWFTAAYSLTAGTFILIAGRLGDVYGHKKFFIAGFVWLALWSILAGFSIYSTQIFFDCCRAMQGIGPAFLLPNALAILGRTYEAGSRKDMVFSIFGATAPGGFVIGGVFSALFAQLTWWPWAFWSMGVFCVVLAVAGIFIIPDTPRPEIKGSASMISRIDAAGSITGVAGLVLVNFAWNQGPVAGWTTPYTYVILIIGALFIGLFAFVESRAAFPLIPSDTLSASTGFVLGCIAAGWSSFGIWLFYLWQFMEELRGETPLQASAHFIPVAFSGLCAALTTGFVLSKLQPSTVMLVAMLAFTAGGILIGTAPVEQTYWAQTFVSLVVMPWGMDMSFPAAMILLSNAMPREHQGIAASLVNTVINYSISIGLGFAGTIEGRVNDGGSDLLKGYHGAWYMGIGLSSLGVGIAVIFGISNCLRSKKLVF